MRTTSAPSKPAGKPSTSQAQRRDEFLRAAADVFALRGYHGAGMREIADRCGVQPAALYYYFPSKASILEAICYYGITQFVERLAAIQAAALPVEDKVHQAVRAHLEPLLENRFYVHAFLFQRRELPAAVRRPLDSLARNYEDLWHALLVEGQTRGVIAREIDRKLTVLAILGMCNAVARWSGVAADQGLDAVATTFTHLISSGLFGGQSATSRPDLRLVNLKPRRKRIAGGAKGTP